MNNIIDYSLYRKELFRYISSLTIKFHPFAEMMEKYVKEHTAYSISTYRENPYYRNLCGEYSFLDTEMEVWSIENNKMVPFNKQLWIDYPGTASLYTYGSDAHVKLCYVYPNQTGLIKSIMYPVQDIDVAYNAPELSLLQHELSFLRSNEQESIYTATIEFLQYIKDRWFIYDYGHEDQYYIVFMSQLYCNLFTCLLKKRVENQDTYAVHNLHVWERLEANGLAPYRDILTDTQSRWFYRNMRHLKENRGIKSNLIILADNLLNTLKVKLVGKKIFQQTFDPSNDCIMVPEFLSDDIVDYSVKGTTVSDNINEYTNTNRSTYYSNITDNYNTVTTLVDMSSKENMDRILNRVHAEGYYPKYSVDDSAEKEYIFGRTTSSTVPTRLLELKKLDAHNPYEHTLRLFMFDTLMYQCANNKLQYKISFTDTFTGLSLELNVKDVTILMHYACYRQYGIVPTILPRYCNVDSAYKMISPALEDLPSHMHFNNFNYSIDQVIKKDELHKDMHWSNGTVYYTVGAFIDLLGKQFETKVKYIRKSFQEADRTYQWVLWYYHSFFLAKERLVLQTEDISYDTWIKSDEDISNFISAYDDLADTKLMYSQLATTLLSKVLPIELSPILLNYAGFIFDYTEYYERLKQLFVDWTSHDLTYLDTDRTLITWLDMGLLSVGTSAEKITSSIDIVDTIEISTYLTEQDTVLLLDEYSSKPTLNNTTMSESTEVEFDKETGNVSIDLSDTYIEIVSETDMGSISSFQLVGVTPFTDL